MHACTARIAAMAFAIAGLASNAARATVEGYESFAEGFLGTTFSSNGVTYRDANQVSGFFPDGEPFTPADLGDQFIIERATFFYDDFPDFGSPHNVLTFGTAFVPGDNLSIGVCASIWMDLDQPARHSSFDIGFYENGPWGGIEYRLEALLDGQVVASDSFLISDLGGRDNPTFETLKVAAAAFDSLHLFARLNGEYTAPRGMIDNLALTPAAPPCVGDVDGNGAVDLSDLTQLLSNFGTSSGATAEQGDLDADGDVDLSDLTLLLANFGVSC